MGAGSNGQATAGSDGPTFRPSGSSLFKGHKRAMSYQYGNNHNTSAPDYNSLTSGGSLGIDFPPSYYSTTAGGSHGGGVIVGGATSSSASNLHHSLSSEAFTGTQLTSRANCLSHNSSNINSNNSSNNNNKVIANQDVSPLEDITHRLDDDDEKSTDALSICSLPPYSDLKGLLLIQDTIDTNNSSINSGSKSLETCDQKPKTTSPMHSKALRNELKKTFLAFVFQQAAQLLMIWTVVKSNDRMDLESPVLPDLILSRVPMVKKAGQWSEILLFTLFLVFTIVVLFHKHRFLVLRRVLAVTGICLVIRSFCVWATVLPRSLSSMECAPKSRNSGEVLHRVFIMYITSGLSIFGGHMCGNYFFSGHTCLMTIVHAAFYQYTPDLFCPLKRLITLLCMAIAVLILLAHNHYTLDILGAYYVASRVWMFYHFLAHNPQYRLSNQLQFCWSWLVNIFEDGSECQVKNEFQSVREIYLMICQQTETLNHSSRHHKHPSRSSQKLQTV
ncbi:uncharacterized protein LOC142358582 [Convolutriloba macropyga]|uniref:uncharacterized protein LOC142358582 n=1 Tax=Convolutriloba macropyga TaxID=536237 RepID=UPI003F51D17F